MQYLWGHDSEYLVHIGLGLEYEYKTTALCKQELRLAVMKYCYFVNNQPLYDGMAPVCPNCMTLVPVIVHFRKLEREHLVRYFPPVPVILKEKVLQISRLIAELRELEKDQKKVGAMKRVIEVCREVCEQHAWCDMDEARLERLRSAIKNYDNTTLAS